MGYEDVLYDAESLGESVAELGSRANQRFEHFRIL